MSSPVGHEPLVFMLFSLLLFESVKRCTVGGMVQMNKGKHGIVSKRKKKPLISALNVHFLAEITDNFINIPDYSCQWPDPHYKLETESSSLVTL